MENIDMKVIKRNGNLQEMSFDKILKRVKGLGKECKLNLNYSSLVIKIIDQLYDKISTSQIDILTAEYCITLSTINPDYGILSSRILISNHHKNTENDFYEVSKILYYNYVQEKHNPLITNEMFIFIEENKEYITSIIDYNRDFLFDYFGFKTLERSYLFKINDKIIERPQHMWLRVAICIHMNSLNSLELIKETYNLMSQKYFTHATPTLYNAGTYKCQLSSCFLISMEDDSLDGIFNTLKDCAKISKYAGGIGLHIHNVRANGSIINSTNGKSNGIIPMLRVFNNTARYINQGGKRNGSFSIYLEPHHPDIEDFLNIKTNRGDEEMKCRDLFYALWIPDLFMERVKNDELWSLFCPNKCPGLSDVYGDDFNKCYIEYENKGLANKIIKARDLWFKILDSQMETGTPYLLYKDACNQKSNQKNIGTIKSSNLCSEIIEYSDDKETAVCNLASIVLGSFVNRDTKEFDYDKLHYVTKVITQNLNNIIDINYYPTEKTKLSNTRHRPIGIGIQGLSDTFFMMDIAFHSEEAKHINKLIFETIYHASLEKSYELSLINGPYSTFQGSPISKGIFQFDMWDNIKLSGRYDWDMLKKCIMDKGIYNSLLVALMPTASTSQIMGYNECFEPITSNIYTRGTSSGEFVVVNKYLTEELMKLGYWNEEIKNNIIENNGSIQHFNFIDENIKNKYKTVWEIPQKFLIDMSSERGAFVCQSQSLNLFVEDPNYKDLTSMHFYGWKKGLKTGIYYLRRKAKASAQKFTIEPTNITNNNETICDMCSA